ncbi:UNVERIFIED_CONTAM: Histidine kinase [Sesamum calycinum]|uniref:histidine kinase n=1 Tax=Sesamum calycinum TaxID=2727403 RepID=A0AAW2SW98_9LAMI
MGSLHTRRLFNRISQLLTSCKARIILPPPCSRRSSSHRDVEEEEIQYESSVCLSSSYYSVFVVRLAIMVMLAILIGLLTLLTWHITRVYTKRSLNTLAYGLRHELLQRPILRMWNILNSTVEVATAQVKLSESVIRRYNRPVNQAEQVELYEVMRDVTWALFASRKALNSITLNYRNGFVQAFHRNHRSNNTYYIYSDLFNYSISGAYDVNLLSSHQGWNDQSIHSNTSAIWYREPLDPQTGEKVGKATEIPPDELINIAGISQVPDGTASWHIAVSKYTDSPLLSAALPVWDPSHESIVAVVGVTTALYSVGQLMKELVEFHSGHIYLTSQEGWLLATSTNTPLLMNSTTGPKLIMAVDSEDNMIRSGAECLQKVYGNKFPPSQEVHIENARLGNQLYYIDSFFLNLKRLPMVESGKLILEETEFDLGRELEGLIDMFSVQCINHNVETVLDLSGIDPNKWESVFESFEQADPSTTRLHGGTGLGLCIVSNPGEFNMVNKMNGEIEVVKKSGPGTLMRLYLLLSTPADLTKQHNQLNLEKHNLTVLLALNGRMTRLVMTQWLQKNGVYTHEAADWNELTLRLQELFKARIYTQNSLVECPTTDEQNAESCLTSVFIIIIDIGLLDLSTEIWKQQLNFLDKYCCRANFAWILNHETSNAIKAELRKRGHLLMVNRPLYKAKMIQIFEAVIRDRSVQLEKNMVALQTPTADGQFHEFLEIDALHSGSVSSDDSEKSENESFTRERAFHVREKASKNLSRATFSQSMILGDYSDLANVNLQDTSNRNNLVQARVKEQHLTKSNCEDQGAAACSHKVNEQKSLEGLCILLAEDTPVLQRVAAIMLEKMGAKVVVVGDGLQAVEALKDKKRLYEYRDESFPEDGRLKTNHVEALPYDLILMDCQMPKMDGYEATKAIRRSEAGTGLHIPIVALTAHAMSSDEAKCLEVGMDAYLTKPIDCKLMVSTILSLTKGT